MKYVVFFLLLFALLSLPACVPSFSCGSSDPINTPVPTGPCHADFYANPTKINSASTVTFTSTSTGNIKTYRWDFGNDRTDVGQTATTFYSKNGYYTVTLTIEGPDCQDSMVKEEYIEVSGC